MQGLSWEWYRHLKEPFRNSGDVQRYFRFFCTIFLTSSLVTWFTQQDFTRTVKIVKVMRARGRDGPTVRRVRRMESRDTSRTFHGTQGETNGIKKRGARGSRELGKQGIVPWFYAASARKAQWVEVGPVIHALQDGIELKLERVCTFLHLDGQEGMEPLEAKRKKKPMKFKIFIIEPNISTFYVY